MWMWFLSCVGTLLVNESGYALIQYVRKTRDVALFIYASSVVLLAGIAMLSLWPEEQSTAMDSALFLFFARRCSVHPSHFVNREFLPLCFLSFATFFMLEKIPLEPFCLFVAFFAFLLVLWRILWIEVAYWGNGIRILFSVALLLNGPLSFFILVPFCVLWSMKSSVTLSLLFPKPLSLKRKKQGFTLLECVISIPLIVAVCSTGAYLALGQFRLVQDVEQRARVRMAMENVLEEARVEIVAKGEKGVAAKELTIPGVSQGKMKLTAEPVAPFLWKVSVQAMWHGRKPFHRSMELLVYKGE